MRCRGAFGCPVSVGCWLGVGCLVLCSSLLGVVTRPAPILELCPLPDLLFLRLHLGVLSLLALPSERCRYVVGFGTLVLVFVWALKMLVPGT